MKPGDMVVVVPNQNEWVFDGIFTRAILVRRSQQDEKFWVVWPFFNASKKSKLLQFPEEMLRVVSSNESR